jgi:hypothetical protein
LAFRPSLSAGSGELCPLKPFENGEFCPLEPFGDGESTRPLVDRTDVLVVLNGSGEPSYFLSWQTGILS